MNPKHWRTILRWVLAVFYFAAGYFHLTAPHIFLKIMPGWVPFPDAVVMWTGIAELLGAVGLAQGFSQRLRAAAAVGLALYAVCVFPANINHFIMDMARPDHGMGLGYHVPRMFAQPLIVWLALWTGQVIDWPMRRAVRLR
ncbi:DoxX family protein [Novosphingobium lentum]|uniref:DoxX family protein n=1 Tax=Novosphingobium lentum TaxID=145287 RepID=UPI000836C2B8|nr:DoxX family protein [Novosphingobium lentum]